MMRKKLLLAVLIPLFSLGIGCSGDEGDDVAINIDGGGGVAPPPPPPPPVGNCDLVVQADFVEFNDDCSAGTLSGVVDEDYTLTSEVEWRLSGPVLVGEGNRNIATQADVEAIRDAGVTLTIEPGTQVRGFDDGTLIVTRGSKLMADGTAFSPITFSSLDADFDGLGEWGGVIIQGFAPQYGAGGTGACFGSGTVCNVQGEGGDAIGAYGGNDPADNSGRIRYLRIAEGGLVAGPNNEVNGLTLMGVGHGTLLEYIQVHNNLDDGIEWFGGTANLKYAVLTGNDDDDLDYDEGYQGNIQYALIIKNQVNPAPQGNNDPRGIEANSSDEDFVPETDAVLANITIIGGPLNNNAEVEVGEQPGMRLRGALTTAIYNTATSNFDTGCIRIDDADVNGDGSLIVESNVTLVNLLNDCEDGIYDKREADSAENVVSLTLTYDANFAIQESAARLASPAVIIAMNNGSGFMFDQTDFIGAVEPGGDAWWRGWTLPGTVEVQEAVQPADFVGCNGDNTICTLTGTIDEDYTLVAGVEWRLSGPVLVGEGNRNIATQADVQAVRDAGVTLTIRPGVHVRGFSDGTLIVTRGSKLDAVGSPAAPITFSSLDPDFDGLGEWGGVIIQGFAPQYGAGGTGACFGSGTVCNVQGEGGDAIGAYGGNDPADNSGRIRYLRIAEGGLVAGPNNEVNGLTLMGVGHGTLLEYIQVHNNLDDGIEWFGGTANLKYAVLTGNDDDDLDYDEGYQGNIQYALIIKNQVNPAPQGNNDPRGIEANSSDEDFVPETDAVLANITIIGGPLNNNAEVEVGEQPGMRLRGALTTAIYNTATSNFDTGCIRIDDADVNGDGSLIVESNVTLVNLLNDCEDGIYDKREADSEQNVVSLMLTYDAAYAVIQPQALVPATNIPAKDNGSDFTFDSTDYIGAVRPGTALEDAWWFGWIIEGSLD